MIELENNIKSQGFDVIIGIDEAGRGPLAGPVVASAVAVKDYNFQSRICDSKKISPTGREKAFHEIYNKAYVGVGIIAESVIDEHNILNATFLAMTRAVQQVIVKMKMPSLADDRVCLLIDGNQFKSTLPYKIRKITKGDASVFSIACASIIAKVTRDRIITMYDQIFPQYGFRQHKGYPTMKHKQALYEFGPSPIHRRSFKY